MISGKLRINYARKKEVIKMSWDVYTKSLLDCNEFRRIERLRVEGGILHNNPLMLPYSLKNIKRFLVSGYGMAKVIELEYTKLDTTYPTPFAFGQRRANI